MLIVYTSIYAICVMAQAVKPLGHKLSHLDQDATKGGKTMLCGFYLL